MIKDIHSIHNPTFEVGDKVYWQSGSGHWAIGTITGVYQRTIGDPLNSRYNIRLEQGHYNQLYFYPIGICSPYMSYKGLVRIKNVST